VLTTPPTEFGKLNFAAYRAASKEEQAEEKNGLAWIPATFRNDGVRRREDVESITALVLDLDNGTSIEVVERELQDFEYVLHTTYSHSPEKPRWRAVMPLNRPIRPAQLWPLFDAFNRRFGGALDAVCGHDPVHFYYLPRCPAGAQEFFVARHHPGELLDYDTEMARGNVAEVIEAATTFAAAITATAEASDAVIISFDQGFPDGERTAALVKRAGQCVAQGTSLAAMTAKCIEWNEKNDPPLPIEKVVETCASIGKTEARKREQAAENTEKAIIEMNQRYVWVKKTSRAFRLEHFDFVSPADLRNTYANQLVEVQQDGRRVMRPLGDAWMRSPSRRECRDIAYLPGKPRIVDGSLNLWTGWGVQAVEGDVTPWREFLQALFASDPASMKWFEQWCAYPIQHPGTKLATAVVLWSAQQGVGKTLLAQGLGRLYGDNFRTITAAELHGSFNSWAKGCQFVLGEENASLDQRADANALKHLITGRTITINEKHQPTYEQRNAMNFLFTSNHPDAFHLEMHDRRFFVWEVTCGKLPASVYKAFANWLGDGGAEALMYHLQHLDLTGFDPYAEAPLTDAKRRMIDASRSELERWLEDVSTPEAMKEAFGKEIVSAEDLARKYQQSFGARVSTTAVGKALVRLGLPVQDRRKVSLPCGKRVNVQVLTRREHWVAQDNTAWVIDYERRAPPGLSAVH